MKLKRLVFLLLTFALFISLYSISASANDEEVYLVRETRKRDSYTYHTTEQLMSMLKMDEPTLQAFRQDVYNAVLSNTRCDVSSYNIGRYDKIQSTKALYS